MRHPLFLPLRKSLTTNSCRKSSVNVHDAPPRDSTAPVMHDPPHNARTGTDRPRDHAVRRRTPLWDFLHNPQDGFNEFFPHSSIILSTAHSTSRGSIGTTARSVSASGSGSSPSSPDTPGPTPLTGLPGVATVPLPSLRPASPLGRPRPRREASVGSSSPARAGASSPAPRGAHRTSSDSRENASPTWYVTPAQSRTRKCAQGSFHALSARETTKANA